jgi:acyl-CoA thioester hydrolase
MSDTSPRFVEGGAHCFRLRVYYEDTDHSGMVYHANYLKFAERARTEVLRDLDISHSALMEDAGLAFTVRRCEVDFLSPARIDDALEVRTTLRALGGATIELDQAIFLPAGERRGKDRELARLAVRLAIVKRDGRPTRLPARIAERMRRLAATACSEAQPGLQPRTLSIVHPRAVARTSQKTMARPTANEKRA